MWVSIPQNLCSLFGSRIDVFMNIFLLLVMVATIISYTRRILGNFGYMYALTNSHRHIMHAVDE